VLLHIEDNHGTNYPTSDDNQDENLTPGNTIFILFQIKDIRQRIANRNEEYSCQRQVNKVIPMIVNAMEYELGNKRYQE
jgi:hypothetical protein